MQSSLARSLKSVPLAGPILVAAKRSLRDGRTALLNTAYYIRTNLDSSGGELLVTDDSHTNSRGRGLFSLFREVLDIIATNGQKDIRVDYRHTLYNERSDENMWEYYFYPVDNGSKKKYFLFFATRPFRNIFSSEDPAQIRLFHEIIRDRIRIKEDLLEEAERFYRDWLLGKKTIGIHYRGTDIHVSTDMHPTKLKVPKLEEYFEVTDRLLGEGYEAIFLATDEAPVFEKFKERYGSELTYRNVERSGDGRAVHKFTVDPRKQGRDVIVDALILAKCDYLLYGPSNVPTVVRYLNPSLPGENLCLI